MLTDRGVRAAVLFCAGIAGALTATPARADWRDGCPPIDQPRPRSSAFGRSGDIDTALSPSRVETRLSYVRFRRPLNSITAPDIILLPVQTHVHIQHTGGPFLSIDLAALQSVAPANALVPDLPTQRYYGNLNAAVGYRDTGYLIGGALRHGVSAKLGAGAAPWTSREGDGVNYPRDVNRIADFMPFNVAAFAHDRPIAFSLEGRIELIGCRGPYVRARADVIGWRPLQERVARNNTAGVFVFPMAVAIGGYVSSTILLEGQFGVELRTHADTERTEPQPPEQPFTFDSGHFLRFRLYAEFQPLCACRHFHLGAFVDAISGDRDGWQLGLAIAGDLKRTHRSEDSIE